MISRRKFALLSVALIVITALLITVSAFWNMFNSGLGGITVYWDGYAPEVGKISGIDRSVLGGSALVSKMYLVSAEGVRQLNFRFTCPGLGKISDIRLFSGEREIPRRTGSFLDRIMGIKCRIAHISLEAPGEEPISGDLRIVFYEGDRESFEIGVSV